LQGHFRYVPIEPIVLLAGRTYVIAATQVEGQNDVMLGTAIAPGFAPEVEFIARRSDQSQDPTGLTLVLPANRFVPDAGVAGTFGPNFRYEVTPAHAATTAEGVATEVDVLAALAGVLETEPGELTLA